MAYVAISNDLVNRVKNRIVSMRNAEIKNELPDIEKTYNIDASYLYNVGCWGAEHLHLMNLIPRDWLNQETSNYVAIKGEAEVEGATKEVGKTINFSGMTTAFRRPSTDYWNKAQSFLTIEQLRHFPSNTPGCAEAIKRWEDAVTEANIIARWKKVEEQMVAFLDKCKSLNEAVKLFPNIKLYLDVQDVQRMERKLDRGPRKELIADIDLEAMTAAAVVAQINGGV